MSGQQGARRRGLLYGRRKGPKLSAHQERLFQTLLPKLELNLDPGCDPRTYFNFAAEEIWLEVGFGCGEHLLWQAENHPRIGLIGAEPYEAGVAKLLSKISPAALLAAQAQHLPHSRSRTGEENESSEFSSPVRSMGQVASGARAPRDGGGLVDRLRIYQGDARDIIEALPDASLGCVFLLFPDPWPKKRHHKRRFIQEQTLDALARAMRPGAELRFASDDPGYVEWTLERIFAHTAFVWTARSPIDWKGRPPDWPPTRYEQKAIQGVPIFLRFQRRGLQTALPKRR